MVIMLIETGEKFSQSIPLNGEGIKGEEGEAWESISAVHSTCGKDSLFTWVR